MRTFRYGYLVTTSPQLSNLPSTAPSPAKHDSNLRDFFTAFSRRDVFSTPVAYSFRIHQASLCCHVTHAYQGLGHRLSGIPDSHGVTGGVYKTGNVFTATF